MEDEDAEDEFIVLSQRSLERAPRHARRTLHQSTGLRRRPFLIFDKTESKGYKQLKDKPQPRTTLQAPRYHPGDGFSGRESKPNGYNLLTKNGIVSTTGPHVGMLDLTQSEPLRVKRKRNARRANLDDNSFASVPTKTRRALQPKDPNLQLEAVTAAVPVKISSSALKPSESAGITIELQETASRNAIGEYAQENSVLGALPQRDVTPVNARCDLNATIDTTVIEKSDDIHKHTGNTRLRRFDMPTAEEHDSGGTHVSDTPPRRARRACSTAAKQLTPQAEDATTEVLRVPGRAFRRVNTH